MDALVMCGGKGTRLESDHEKPLHPIEGIAMVDRVVTALERSHVETIYAAVSPNAPETRAHLSESDRDVTTIDTAGDGYVADLLTVLDRPDVPTPILTVAADLPLLDADTVDQILDVSDERGGTGSLTVCVPETCKHRLGVSIDSRLDSDDAGTELVPTGVNVVGEPTQDESTAEPETETDATSDSEPESMTYVTDEPRLAINVNRLEDARIAADRLRRGEER